MNALDFQPMQIADGEVWGCMDRGRSFIISHEPAEGRPYWASFKDRKDQKPQWLGDFETRTEAVLACIKNRRRLS